MGSVELSAVLSVIGIILLFLTSILVVLVAPQHVDKSWVEPTSSYQVQIYELADPNVFISGMRPDTQEVEVVNRLVSGESLLAFQESKTLKIKAEEGLESYVTKEGEKPLKLTSRLLLLRPLDEKGASGETFELFDPKKEEAFSIGSPDVVLENWVDKDFVVLDPKNPWHEVSGVIYKSNPVEYRVSTYIEAGRKVWKYDPSGEPIASLDTLKEAPYSFLSRKELIQEGEHVYQIEGCWYCHTDQTRTLVQDLVLNGSDSFPSPPSSANEYIYQEVTFPGTKRNGPDLSRTGIKRPSRDWHKAHFWAPKTQSKGSIMPAFRHFFDFDPRGTGRKTVGVPNYKFEAIFQYLMTKGTRITPPTEAWWIGKDPVHTLEIIEGRR